MGIVENLLERLFPSNDGGEVNIDRGIIKRTETWKQHYEGWKATNGAYCLLEIKRNLVQSKRDLRDDLHTIWLDLKNAKGFRISLPELIDDQKNDPFLLELLKDRILENGYQLNSSRYEYSEHKGQLNSSEWYSLKPPLKNFTTTPPFDQLFGNVKLELDYNEEMQSRTLKVITTTYTDHMYKDAESFDTLMERMFEPLSS